MKLQSIPSNLPPYPIPPKRRRSGENNVDQSESTPTQPYNQRKRKRAVTENVNNEDDHTESDGDGEAEEDAESDDKVVSAAASSASTPKRTRPLRLPTRHGRTLSYLLSAATELSPPKPKIFKEKVTRGRKTNAMREVENKQQNQRLLLASTSNPAHQASPSGQVNSTLALPPPPMASPLSSSLLMRSSHSSPFTSPSSVLFLSAPSSSASPSTSPPVMSQISLTNSSPTFASSSNQPKAKRQKTSSSARKTNANKKTTVRKGRGRQAQSEVKASESPSQGNDFDLSAPFFSNTAFQLSSMDTTAAMNGFGEFCTLPVAVPSVDVTQLTSAFTLNMGSEGVNWSTAAATIQSNAPILGPSQTNSSQTSPITVMATSIDQSLQPTTASSSYLSLSLPARHVANSWSAHSSHCYDRSSSVSPARLPNDYLPHCSGQVLLGVPSPLPNRSVSPPNAFAAQHYSERTEEDWMADSLLANSPPNHASSLVNANSHQYLTNQLSESSISQ